MSPAPASHSRPARAHVDLGAVRANARVLGEHVVPARLMAVVKGDAYGHGAIPVAEAAVAAGAAMLAVATLEEAVELRDAALDVPILLLSEIPPGSETTAVSLALEVVVAGHEAAARLGQAARSRDTVGDVHLKVDTGMHRLGCTPDAAVRLAEEIDRCPSLRLAGVMTHLAVADELDNPATASQLDQFDEVLGALEQAGLRPPLVHAANSAAAIASPRSRYDAVRVGIALYGLAPAPALDGAVPLVPAMELKADVTAVRTVRVGAGVSYGHRWRASRATSVATAPVGYADGVPRQLGIAGGEVLVAGRRCPIVGAVTMDQLMIDIGDLDVAVGDEVVLFGDQSGERVSAWEWAGALDTIAYEIVTGIGSRVPRVHHG